MIKKIYTTVYVNSERKGLFIFSNSNKMDEFSDLKKIPHSSDPIAEKSFVAHLTKQFRKLAQTNSTISCALLMLMISPLCNLSKQTLDFN
tara:strand:+ start:748 stop:1017 length:270 start_codon:yes stop_codon:yes gene_type:complete